MSLMDACQSMEACESLLFEFDNPRGIEVTFTRESGMHPTKTEITRLAQANGLFFLTRADDSELIYKQDVVLQLVLSPPPIVEEPEPIPDDQVEDLLKSLVAALPHLDEASKQRLRDALAA